MRFGVRALAFGAAGSPNLRRMQLAPAYLPCPAGRKQIRQARLRGCLGATRATRARLFRPFGLNTPLCCVMRSGFALGMRATRARLFRPFGLNTPLCRAMRSGFALGMRAAFWRCFDFIGSICDAQRPMRAKNTVTPALARRTVTQFA